jgi:hypothetical protein
MRELCVTGSIGSGLKKKPRNASATQRSIADIVIADIVPILGVIVFFSGLRHHRNILIVNVSRGTKMNRRDFLKMAFTALLGALAVPRKAEAEPVDCGQRDEVATIKPDLYDQYRAVLDRCECNFDVQVHYEQCRPCSRCGGTGWLYDDIGWSYPCPKCHQENPLSSSVIVPAGDVEFVPEAEWETPYARDLGKATLTQAEKRQAWLNHVSEEYPGWCESLGIVNTGHADAVTSVPCLPMDSVMDATIKSVLDDPGAEPGAQVFYTRDKGETWEYFGEIISTGYVDKTMSVPCPPMDSLMDVLIQRNVKLQLDNAPWVSARIENVVWTPEDGES